MKSSRTIYAVLGMLLQGPQSGYDLKLVFEQKVRHFWMESVGQIYPALRSAEERGWVRARKADRGGRARTEYTLTARGRSALSAWFGEQPAPPPVRHEMLLRTFFAARMGPESLQALAEHVAEFEGQQIAMGVAYDHMKKEIEDQATSPEEEALWKLTLYSGEEIRRARMAWCRRAKRVLSTLSKRRKGAAS